MIILGIETSCDDTGVAIINSKENIEVLANFVSSQELIHSPYGGVFPALAKREHQKNIFPLFRKALKKSGLLKKRKERITINDKEHKELKKILSRDEQLFLDLLFFFEHYEKPAIDRIALTKGPGLEPCLWVGVNFAKALSFFWNIEIIPVNHLAGHIFANYIEQNPQINFPAIGLIISGGNTQLLLLKDMNSYKIIGDTRDDAAGECFDKTARILGLGYPGGKKISALAKKAKNILEIKLPRPMIHEKNLDFSFSGLKTAVLYDTKKRTPEILNSEEYMSQMAKEVEDSISEVIVKKTKNALIKYNGKSLIIGGGVSANQNIRKNLKALAKEMSIEMYFPKLKYTGDNAVMIAITALIGNAKSIPYSRLKPNSNFRLNDK